MSVRTREQLKAWWVRIHEIAPWAIATDPYLEGIHPLEVAELREVEDFDAWWQFRIEGPK